MRLPAWALILTIFTLLCPIPVNAKPMALHIRAQQSDPNTTTSTTSASSTTTSSSSTTVSTTSSSITSTSSSTSSISSATTSSTSSSFSSSATPSSSFSTSSSLSSSEVASSSLQNTASSSQPTQTTSSSTSSFVTSDTTSTTSLSSQTQTQTQSRTTFTSTGSDGTLVTVTAVVSSPSGGSGSSIVSTARQGFFANTGAVAGTFLVVGLVGTGVFICAFLWVLRRYRRRKRYLSYFDAEEKEFNRPRERGVTPEPSLPDIARDSTLDIPLSSSPTPNMIERLHGNEAVTPNISYDSSLYQAQPGEFDPYRNVDGPYAYSDDHAVYGQYPTNSQPDNLAYAYQPGTVFNNTGQHQAVVGPLHAP